MQITTTQVSFSDKAIKLYALSLDEVLKGNKDKDVGRSLKKANRTMDIIFPFKIISHEIFSKLYKKPGA